MSARASPRYNDASTMIMRNQREIRDRLDSLAELVGVYRNEDIGFQESEIDNPDKSADQIRADLEAMDRNLEALEKFYQRMVNEMDSLYQGAYQARKEIKEIIPNIAWWKDAQDVSR